MLVMQYDRVAHFVIVRQNSLNLNQSNAWDASLGEKKIGISQLVALKGFSTVIDL